METEPREADRPVSQLLPVDRQRPQPKCLLPGLACLPLDRPPCQVLLSLRCPRKSYVSSLEEGKEHSVQGSCTAWPQPLPGTGLLLFSQTASALSCHKPPEALSSDIATETREWFQLNVGSTVHEPESLCIRVNVRSLRVAAPNGHAHSLKARNLGTRNQGPE